MKLITSVSKRGNVTCREKEVSSISNNTGNLFACTSACSMPFYAIVNVDHRIF